MLSALLGPQSNYVVITYCIWWCTVYGK